MKPADLLDAARRLVEKPHNLTDGFWGRAATFLARQALEQRLSDILALRAPGSQNAPFDARLLVLGEVLGNRELAAQARYTWATLSQASHHHSYELPPTSHELRDWIEAVDKFLKNTGEHVA